MPGARPTVYRQEVADEICQRMASGESLRSICRDSGMPGESTVRSWSLANVEGFSAHYARARENQAHSLAEELLEIADDGSNDWMERNDPDNPGWQVNGEHLQRSRLRFDARKWLASKIMPKVYGERITQEIEGDLNIHRVLSEAPLTIEEWDRLNVDKTGSE